MEGLKEYILKEDAVRMGDDTINRQAAIDAIEQHKTAVLEGREWDEGIAYGYAAAHTHLVEIVKQLPSAEPEIIRCKDCKWWKSNFTWNGKEVKVCVKEPYEPVRAEDFFCKDGERGE